VEANRNFANKIWNAGRFVIGALETAPDAPLAKPDWTLADTWIYARLQALVREVERLFGSYQYGEAGRQIYDFFWSEFADWYLEIAKYQLTLGGDRAFYTAQTLSQILDTCLRLLHPFTPYITEELWGHLKRACQAKSTHFEPKHGWEEALIIARWPELRQPEGWEDQKVADFGLVQDVVRAIRNLRSEKKVAPGKRIPAILAAGEKLDVLQSQAQTILSLATVDPAAFELAASLSEKPQNAVSLVASGIEIYLPLTGLVDAAAERARLAKELGEVESQIVRLDALVTGPFGQRAPAAVVDKERQKLATYQETAAKLRSQLQDLG
jgi:valyl-tRNA synthetase